MRKDNKLTEHYLLPLNLCFLSFFGVFLVYELDKWAMNTGQSSSPFSIVMCGIATILLISSIRFRNRYLLLAAILVSLVGVMILSSNW